MSLRKSLLRSGLEGRPGRRHRGIRGPRRQKGVALIVVLMMFAILYVIAIEVMYRQDRFRARTENLLEWDARYQYALAAEAIARRGLLDDLNSDREDGSMVDDCQDEIWAVNLPPTPYEDALISATVQDLQGRFNLNWLVRLEGDQFVRDEAWRERLALLLAATLTDPGKAERLSHEMADWLDSNNIVDGIEGAEDAEYRYRRTANLPAAHESEMRALLSMRAEDIPEENFWGLFTALPNDTRLNINTAPLPVLDAIFADTVGAAGTQRVAEIRQQGAIDDVGTLLGEPPFNQLETEQRQQLAEILDVRSDFFQVMINIQRAQQRSRLITRIHRPAQGASQVFSRQLVPVMGPLEAACNPLYEVEQGEGGGME